jgi:hypothetical protein
VIEPVRGLTLGGPTISAAGTAGAGDNLRIHGATTGQTATQVMGFTPFLYVPSMAGMWGQLYFTTAGVTQGGDSGGPVLLDGTDQLVGHLVGASGVITSYIQAIDIQLKAVGATLRPCP